MLSKKKTEIEKRSASIKQKRNCKINLTALTPCRKKDWAIFGCKKNSISKKRLNYFQNWTNFTFMTLSIFNWITMTFFSWRCENCLRLSDFNEITSEKPDHINFHFPSRALDYQQHAKKDFRCRNLKIPIDDSHIRKMKVIVYSHGDERKLSAMRLLNKSASFIRVWQILSRFSLKRRSMEFHSSFFCLFW